MNITTTNLPGNYKEIIASTRDGFVLIKPDETSQTIDIALTDKKFLICKEVSLQGYKRNLNQLIINPNNIATFGYLSVDSTLIIYNDEGQELKQISSRCAAASYDDQNNLYLAERIDDTTLYLSILDESFNQLYNQELIDPIYDSYVDFEFHPQLKRMFLSLAGGQDGCVYYTLDVEKSQIVLQEFANDLALIATDENNQHFLSIDPYSCMLIYNTYPDLKEVTAFDYFEYFDESDVNFSLIYLKESFYLIFFNGIPYIYDAIDATIIKEIKLEGHPPKAIKDFYPSLSDENLMSDIESAKQFDSIVAFKTIDTCGFYLNLSDLL